MKLKRKWNGSNENSLRHFEETSTDISDILPELLDNSNDLDHTPTFLHLSRVRDLVGANKSPIGEVYCRGSAPFQFQTVSKSFVTSAFMSTRIFRVLHLARNRL